MLDIPELDTLTPEQRRKVLAIAQDVLEVAHQAAHGQRLPVPLLDDLLPPNQRAYCAVRRRRAGNLANDHEYTNDTTPRTTND